jgi:hypothetical protein
LDVQTFRSVEIETFTSLRESITYGKISLDRSAGGVPKCGGNGDEKSFVYLENRYFLPF